MYVRLMQCIGDDVVHYSTTCYPWLLCFVWCKSDFWCVYIWIIERRRASGLLMVLKCQRSGSGGHEDVADLTLVVCGRANFLYFLYVRECGMSLKHALLLPILLSSYIPFVPPFPSLPPRPQEKRFNVLWSRDDGLELISNPF